MYFINSTSIKSLVFNPKITSHCSSGFHSQNMQSLKLTKVSIICDSLFSTAPAFHSGAAIVIHVHVSHSVISNSLRPCGLQPTRLLCAWDSPGKKTGVGSQSLLQGNFPTQGWKLGLLHCRLILYHLSYQGSPAIVMPRLKYQTPSKPHSHRFQN